MQGKPLVLLLSVLYGSAFIAGFNENLVNMALVSIMAEYGVDSVTAQWLVTGYMIVATVVVTCMAFLYRRFHVRTLFFGAAGLSIVEKATGPACFSASRNVKMSFDFIGKRESPDKNNKIPAISAMNVQKSLRNSKSGKPPRHRERPASGKRKERGGAGLQPCLASHSYNAARPEWTTETKK